MPDAIERQGVLARFQSNASGVDKHPKAILCQVISGNLIAACLKSLYRAAAQPALAVDAALRPEDRGDFESRIRLDSHSDL